MSTITTRTDLYTRVTARILADLERGVRPWLQPWEAAPATGRVTRPLRHNGTPYRGVNILILWSEATAKGYASPTWMTFKQAATLGGHVRKGEHGTLVVYADTFTTTETIDEGEAVERRIPFLKSYTAFNIEQIADLPAQYAATPPPPGDLPPRLERAERFFAATGAVIRHGGDRAYYSPSRDVIQLPLPEAFRDTESYAATKAHEALHWTKAETRLNRDFGGKRFGDAGYAREELTAELGAAFLCADLGITPEPREDHAAYLASWLRVLRADTRAIFTAAAHAQRAVDYLHHLQEGRA
jgi:antirestriction protein ArdC